MAGTATKDAYYFRHDSNTRNDPKIVKVRRVLGREGSDVYFDVLSMLREQADYRLPTATIPDLAYSLRYPERKLRQLLEDFELFSFSDDHFLSPRLCRDMHDWEAKKQSYSARGKKGRQAQLEQKPDSAQAEPEQKPGNKVYNINKEKKINKSTLRAPEVSQSRGSHCPTWEAVYECFVRLGAPDKALEFFNYWEGLGWMKGVTPISNFTSFANRWLANPISQAEAQQTGRKVILEHNGGEVTWPEEKYEQYCNNKAASGYNFLRYEL